MERERGFLHLICIEISTHEIADALFVSPQNIDTYRYHLLATRRAKHDVGSIRFAYAYGMI